MIDINNKKYAVALEWTFLDSKPKINEGEIVYKRGPESYIHGKTNQAQNYGLPALALIILSDANYDDALIYIVKSDFLIWLCIISEHNIELDATYKNEAALVDDLKVVQNDVSKNYTIYCNFDLKGFEVIKIDEDFFDVITSKRMKKVKKKSSRKQILMLFFVFVSFGAGMSIIHNAFKQKPLVEKIVSTSPPKINAISTDLIKDLLTLPLWSKNLRLTTIECNPQCLVTYENGSSKKTLTLELTLNTLEPLQQTRTAIPKMKIHGTRYEISIDFFNLERLKGWYFDSLSWHVQKNMLTIKGPTNV